MKALSIRARIQLWFVGLGGALLVAFAAAVAWHSSRTSLLAFDQALGLRADALAAVCEFENGHFLCELAPAAAARLAAESPRRSWLVQVVAGGAVVASSDDRAVQELSARPPIADHADASPATREFGGDVRVCERIRRYPTGEGDATAALRIVTAEELGPLHRDQRRLVLTLGLGVAASLVGLVFAGWFLSRRIVDPLAALAAAAERVQAGRPERLPQGGSGDEIDQLAASLARALHRLQDALARQARFTADASHELRTPLAIVRTQAEVALHRPREADEYRAVLAEITQGTRRMGDILQSLLLLARADAGSLDFVEDDVDLVAVADDVIAARARAALDKRLDLQRTGAVTAIVRGDRQLLTILLDNLVANAIRYSERPGPIVIAVETRPDGLLLTVVDRGIGIAADRVPHLFERFFRADADRSRAAGGSGLGLSIVRAIAERHGAVCRVESALAQGTRVEVRFPLAHGHDRGGGEPADGGSGEVSAGAG